ncbi:hypothetical protein VTN77DRAFT_402 [Rasamsonia byssochlamydoides]|uniref:uncharacterized protein n=1 Tax=Rasamsonia byssochlamydoides TaxID=89139 RepID=UPI003742DBBB
MNTQNSQQVPMGESDQAQPFQAEPQHRDAATHIPYATVQGSHDTSVGPRPTTNAVGTHVPSGLNPPIARLGPRYGNLRANLSSPVAPNVELPGFQRPPCNGQSMMLPGGGMISGMPHANHFGQPQLPGHEQINPFVPPVPPSIYYPGFVAGTPITPGAFPGYSWPFPLNNGDVPALNGPRQGSWSSAEESKASVNPMGDHNNFHPSAGPVERTSLTGFPMNMPPLHIPQPCPQYQMMKTSTGYVIQDLEALTQQDPPIPRAVPAMWTNSSDLTLAKCLENREGITNVYIRGFLPETTDEMLHGYASRFGQIERCKAIVDLETGMCKGFAFVQFFNFDACENCIRGFFYLGYQASFAQKSRNSRLKDLEDKNSTNIYCTNVPITWSEADLRRHFEPYRVVSEKISRDEKTGVSKEVGFARFETREIAESVLAQFHNIPGKDGVKLLLRFADTKAQKLLKQQSNERRAYRAGEYNYSVEVVQGSTPSPSTSRLAHGISQASPGSPMSYQSPVGAGPVWTPATTISPSGPVLKSSGNKRGLNSWSSRTPLANIENTPAFRGRLASMTPSTLAENHQPAASPKTVPPMAMSQTRTPSPKKEKASSVSPVASRKEIHESSPKSSV